MSFNPTIYSDDEDNLLIYTSHTSNPIIDDLFLRPPPIQGTDDIFVVEKILEEKCVDGTHYYLVKWDGYPEDEATWEPFENVPWAAAENDIPRE